MRTPTCGLRTVRPPVSFNEWCQGEHLFLAPPPTVDKLIHYVNLDGRVNAFYSTAEAFASALNAANVTWTVKVIHTA